MKEDCEWGTDWESGAEEGTWCNVSGGVWLSILHQQDEIIWRVTCTDCAAPEGVCLGQKGASGVQSSLSINTDWWWTQAKDVQAKVDYRKKQAMEPPKRNLLKAAWFEECAVE